MATSSSAPAVNPAATAAINSATSTAAGANSSTGLGLDKKTIAGNFQTFLTLLTTQLKNQNPLDPLDTNQFTQQLVSFAQVEQQLRSNDQLATLVSLQKTAQATAALNFVGQTVVVDGATAQLVNNQATWSFTSPKPVTATITIKDSTGQTAYSGNFTLQTGPQGFEWDGKGNDGSQWPSGAYTMSITSKDANGQAVAIATEVQGMVDSVDLTQNPPLLSIGGRNYTLDQIKRIVRATS
jgi:flagellar basal-body rod modification protein FlgD